MFGKAKKRTRIIEFDGVKYLLSFWEDDGLGVTLPYCSISVREKWRFLFWTFEDWTVKETFWTEKDRITTAINFIKKWNATAKFSKEEVKRVEEFCSGG